MSEQRELFVTVHGLVDAKKAIDGLRSRVHGMVQQAINDAIERVTEHAEEAAPGWKERAIGYVRAYAEQHTFMLCEHCRIHAELDGFKAPIDGRAWGGIMRAAAKRGIIVADGYAPADSSNRSPKVRWRSRVQGNA